MEKIRSKTVWVHNYIFKETAVLIKKSTQLKLSNANGSLWIDCKRNKSWLKAIPIQVPSWHGEFR